MRPVAIIDYLEGGDSRDTFPDGFPDVTREHAAGCWGSRVRPLAGERLAVITAASAGAGR